MKLTYRSPKIFKHGGIFLRIDRKWYRIFRIGPQ